MLRLDHDPVPWREPSELDAFGSLLFRRNAEVVDDVMPDTTQVAEGVNTLKRLKDHAETIGVRMPLVAGLYEILYNGRSIPEVVGKLMLAEQNRDVEYSLK